MTPDQQEARRWTISKWPEPDGRVVVEGPLTPPTKDGLFGMDWAGSACVDVIELGPVSALVEAAREACGDVDLWRLAKLRAALAPFEENPNA